MELSEKHMTEAAKMEPDNKRLQLNLAVLHVQGRNQELVQEGKDSLEKLNHRRAVPPASSTTLAMTALRSNDLAGALSFTTRLVADPKAAFDDRILAPVHAGEQQKPGGGELPGQSEEGIGEQAQSDLRPGGLDGRAGHVRRGPEVDQWFVVRGQEKLAGHHGPGQACCSTARTGRRWVRCSRERKWYELEFARQGFLAKLAMERNETLAAKGYWRAAVREAGERLKPLTALAQMAHSWNWKEDKEELLWLIIRRFPNERWTLRELDQYYSSDRKHARLEPGVFVHAGV